MGGGGAAGVLSWVWTLGRERSSSGNDATLVECGCQHSPFRWQRAATEEQETDRGDCSRQLEAKIKYSPLKCQFERRCYAELTDQQLDTFFWGHNWTFPPEDLSHNFREKWMKRKKSWHTPAVSQSQAASWYANDISTALSLQKTNINEQRSHSPVNGLAFPAAGSLLQQQRVRNCSSYCGVEMLLFQRTKVVDRRRRRKKTTLLPSAIKESFSS